MAKIHINIPDDVLRDARTARVNLSAGAREGICARTYGNGVYVRADWYEVAREAVGSDGLCPEAASVWPPLDLSRLRQPVGQDHDELGQRVHELGERLDGTDGKLRGIATYAAIVTGVLVVGTVVVYASTR